MKPKFYIEGIYPTKVDFAKPKEPDENFNVRLGYFNLTAEFSLIGSGNFSEYIDSDGRPMLDKMCIDILEGKLKINNP